MSDGVPSGRRERKKAATRASIAAAATKLFLERGFDDVTVREVADEADVSPKTVFTYFPQKEALAFGDEDDRHDRLVEAVRDRASGTTVSQALRAHYLAEIADMSRGPQKRMLGLMEKTPSLVDYAEKMWLRHEDALSAEIAQELGLAEPSDEVSFYVRFALQIQLGAIKSEDPEAAIDAGFRVLDEGWNRYRLPG